jgi:enoyl-CoA hydratase/carnithine racemase
MSEAPSTTEAPVVVERRGHVGWILLNRPAQGNAINAAMFDALERAWEELDADPSVRVIVNGAMGKSFCTGLDVVQLATDKEALRRHSRRTRDAELRFTSWQIGVAKPVICAVNGVCAGAGLHFVADADIVLLASDAVLMDPHVSVGQVSAYETIALVRKSPMEPVLRMALTGRSERMPAARAYQLGITSELVDPPTRLHDRAQELAETIARNSPAAMAATKRALWGALESGLTEACAAGAMELVGLWGHPDQAEGPAAFAEKRPAQWAPITGRDKGVSERSEQGPSSP